MGTGRDELTGEEERIWVGRRRLDGRGVGKDRIGLDWTRRIGTAGPDCGYGWRMCCLCVVVCFVLFLLVMPVSVGSAAQQSKAKQNRPERVKQARVRTLTELLLGRGEAGRGVRVRVPGGTAAFTRSLTRTRNMNRTRIEPGPARCQD